jgi:hypothetical protein
LPTELKSSGSPVSSPMSTRVQPACLMDRARSLPSMSALTATVHSMGLPHPEISPQSFIDLLVSMFQVWSRNPIFSTPCSSTSLRTSSNTLLGSLPLQGEPNPMG